MTHKNIISKKEMENRSKQFIKMDDRSIESLKEIMLNTSLSIHHNKLNIDNSEKIKRKELFNSRIEYWKNERPKLVNSNYIPKKESKDIHVKNQFLDVMNHFVDVQDEMAIMEIQHILDNYKYSSCYKIEIIKDIINKLKEIII